MSEVATRQGFADAAAATAMRRPRARRGLIVSLLAVPLAVGLAWLGWRWWTVGRFIESTDDAYVGGEVTVVAPKVSGLIAVVAVTDNQAVREGDLLVRIDDRDYRAAFARAEAAVAAQEATLANIEARRRLQDATVAEARADIAAADAEVTRAREDQDRYRYLSTTTAASVQAFQKADAEAKKALAAASRSRAALDAATTQLDVIATERGQTEAALAGATADRDLARLNLSYTEVRAPEDGTVGNRVARVGGYATAGAQLLAVVPARGLWVDANFKETQLAAMRPGMRATVEADVAPDHDFAGRVLSLAPATGAQFSVIPPENATGNFTKIVQRVPVRIALDGEAGALGTLRPGLSVTVRVNGRDDGAR